MQSAAEAIADRWREEDRGYKTPCWVWMKGCTTGGYAEAFAEGCVRYGHRISYELHVGRIPEGMMLDHLCRVRNCINPGHLEPVTDFENRRRGGTLKLNWNSVREIRRRYRPGRGGRPDRHGRTNRGNGQELAVEFGVSLGTIRAIVQGWRWPEPDS